MIDFIDNIILGDCLEIMKDIPDRSIDMILCDLPYGTTDCKWDIVLPFEDLWHQYKRIIKENKSIVLFGKQPFSSFLVLSNLNWFKYEIIWNKKVGTDFAQANNKPINIHEEIFVFSSGRVPYNRIDDDGYKPYSDKRTIKQSSQLGARGLVTRTPFKDKTTRTPTTIRTYFPDNRKGKGSSLHPAQKPLDLMLWLVKSYSNENEIVLDNCIGSGTTAIACINTNRRFIGIEKEEEYVKISKDRINGNKEL